MAHATHTSPTGDGQASTTTVRGEETGEEREEDSPSWNLFF